MPVHKTADQVSTKLVIDGLVSLLTEAKQFCLFCKMEKSEFCVVIKHLHLKGLTPKEIKSELDAVHGTSVPVFAAVYNWVKEFKRGRTSTNNEQGSGRPVEVTTPEMCDKILDMVMNDRRIKVCEIAETTGISQDTVFTILHKNLGVKKIVARWCHGYSQWKTSGTV
uniref:Mos1 transposase HTH domain-containing protein n=1 Tax=Graphocephala atropunctata TaxID=36148 RepID=A0A1B6LP53_9HEMI